MRDTLKLLQPIFRVLVLSLSAPYFDVYLLFDSFFIGNSCIKLDRRLLQEAWNIKGTNRLIGRNRGLSVRCTGCCQQLARGHYTIGIESETSSIASSACETHTRAMFLVV